MAIEIVCNFRKCRKPLSNQAWVTTCSHAFCTQHGKQEFSKNEEECMTCPACGTELRDKFDVIQANLRPNETFKTIVLAGLRPEVIMDIALRAMAFWAYQMEKEILYQEGLAKHAREKLHSVKEVNTLTQQKLEAKLESFKRKICCLQADCTKKSQLAENMKVRLAEKNREIQMLSLELDIHKRGMGNEGMSRANEEQQSCVDNLLRMVTKQPSFSKMDQDNISLVEQSNDHNRMDNITDLVTRNTSYGFIVLPGNDEDNLPRICTLKGFDVQNIKARQLKHCHVRPVDF